MDNVLINRANVPAAQTWNRLRANSLSVTVPNHADAGTVYLPLPRLFERIECGMGQEVTDYVESQAFKSDFYNVPARTKREEPIVVAVSAAQNQCANTGIIVREGAEATVVIAAFAGDACDGGNAPAGSDANDDALPTSAALTRIVVEAGAKLHLIEMLGVNEGQQHLESVGLEIHQNAAVDVKQYALGGSTIGLGLTANLVGARARLDLNNRYHSTHEETLDINHLVRMRGTSTRAQLTESGVLNEAAKKTLRATIDLVRGAKDAQGNEIETVMILGDDVVNKTMPVILCDEDDVAGNHGATMDPSPLSSLITLQLEDFLARLLSSCLYALSLKTPSSTRLRRFPTAWLLSVARLSWAQKLLTTMTDLQLVTTQLATPWLPVMAGIPTLKPIPAKVVSRNDRRRSCSDYR